MEQAILIKPITVDDLLKKIRNVIKEELLDESNKQLMEKFLSADEVCKLFIPKISKVTLYNWKKKGIIIDRKIGNRSCYKYSEIASAVKQMKRYSSRFAI